MKASVSLLLLSAASMASAAMSVSQCAQMCLSNMKAKAGELGCSAGDDKCLCSQANYGYGIRDCTTEACPDDDAIAVLSSALSSCPSDSAAVTATGAGGSSSGSGSGSDSGAGSTRHPRPCLRRPRPRPCRSWTSSPKTRCDR
ncbi:hypothetical protein KXV40_007449 [Aspergillus fumigatus]|nr:hypothetical protein KXV40_007449 [Aspergillus fumigatus]